MHIVVLLQIPLLFVYFRNNIQQSLVYSGCGAVNNSVGLMVLIPRSSEPATGTNIPPLLIQWWDSGIALILSFARRGEPPPGSDVSHGGADRGKDTRLLRASSEPRLWPANKAQGRSQLSGATAAPLSSSPVAHSSCDSPTPTANYRRRLGRLLTITTTSGADRRLLLLSLSVQPHADR